MMENLKTYIICLTLIVLTSCNNNDDYQFQDLKAFYSSNLQPEVFTFKNNQDIKFIGKQGTRVSIPRGAISHVKGDVKISFQEFFNKSDLILNNIPTNAEGDKWLETGGSFFLNIQDSTGKRVYFDANILFEFSINSNIADISNMSVWRGDGEAPFGSVRPFTRWREVTNPNSSARILIDSLNEGFIMSTPNFNWINCDHVFETTSELTKVRVSVSNKELDINEVNTFMVLKNTNAVLRLYQHNDAFESFPIPVGEEAFIVSLGINDGYYLYIEETTISKNQQERITLDQIELDALIKRIKALDK